jgi:rare lipoprotein A
LPDVERIPEPAVEDLPRSRYGNRSPYSVLGKSYTVLASAEGYDATGLASYYGNKFHGRRTSNLEVYDMYAFTAAHKTLPLPSFARVTNLANGRSVIVRVNDRGPFHDGRLIDLSFAAAVKLGVYPHGTAQVQVHGLTPADMALDSDQRLARGDSAPSARGAVETPAATATVQARTPSALDGLVATLPAAAGATTAGDAVLAANASAMSPVATTATAASTTTRPLDDGSAPTPTPPDAGDTDWRFDMRQDGRTMSADEFDAWMRARRARVATGKPATVESPAAQPALPPATPPAAIANAAAATAAMPAQAVAPPVAQAASPDAITLQVASFAARANAERALAMVNGAGIGNARLLDAQANGRKVWRLRISAVPPGDAAELGTRLQGLGFGQPQRVRE